MNFSHLTLFPLGMAKGMRSRFNRALLRGQYPTFLLLEITERCNCRCRMCHIWEKKESLELSIKDYEHLFRDPLWRNLRILSLTGGEPFLRRDLADIILLATKCLPRLERISFPSNGILTKHIVDTVRSILASLPSHIAFKIGISIDGIQEIHDQMRGVPGSFDKATETVRQLKSLNSPNFSVGILSLITLETIPHLQKAHDVFKSLTTEITYTIATQSPFFGNLESGIAPFSPEEKTALFRFINETLIPEFPEKAYLYDKYKDHISKDKRTYPCLAGYLSAYIDVNGNLFPCHYVGEDFAIAKRSDADETLEQAWFSQKGRAMRQRLKNYSYCRNCSNNCDSRNLIREDFWDFFFYLLSHPAIPLKALNKIIKTGRS